MSNLLFIDHFLLIDWLHFPYFGRNKLVHDVAMRAPMLLNDSHAVTSWKHLVPPKPPSQYRQRRQQQFLPFTCALLFVSLQRHYAVFIVDVCFLVVVSAAIAVEEDETHANRWRRLRRSTCLHPIVLFIVWLIVLFAWPKSHLLVRKPLCWSSCSSCCHVWFAAFPAGFGWWALNWKRTSVNDWQPLLARLLFHPRLVYLPHRRLLRFTDTQTDFLRIYCLLQQKKNPKAVETTRRFFSFQFTHFNQRPRLSACIISSSFSVFLLANGLGNGGGGGVAIAFNVQHLLGLSLWWCARDHQTAKQQSVINKRRPATHKIISTQIASQSNHTHKVVKATGGLKEFFSFIQFLLSKMGERRLRTCWNAPTSFLKQ